MLPRRVDFISSRDPVAAKRRIAIRIKDKNLLDA
jgi:hypothetical protein